jgi:hypothetical protein
MFLVADVKVFTPTVKVYIAGCVYKSAQAAREAA